MCRKTYDAAGNRTIEALVGPVGCYTQKILTCIKKKNLYLLELPSVYILTSFFDQEAIIDTKDKVT